MAILNNLIVHGRSRFLNGINANTINAKSIGANKGVFNELIATTLNVETATIDDLTAQNATVVGLLDVRGELKTNTWSNSNIATIEGNFFIAPTLASGTGETLVSGLTISFASNNWTITITGTFDLNQIGADPVDSSDTATNQWSVGSKVLITGEIGKTDGIYPLGTLMGEIQSASPSSFTITKVTDNLGKTDILSTLGTGTYQYRNVKISLTQRKYGNSSTASNNMRPIGILMSAQGRSSKSFIDIYGGANNLRSGAISGATTDFGGLAIPNVRIGNLRGLPNVVSGDFTQNESLPTGWGIYTDNGYFKGTIVSTSGKIGNFTLGTAIYGAASGAGPSSISATTAGTYLGTDGFRSNKSGDTTKYVQITDGIITAKGADITGAVNATSFIAYDNANNTNRIRTTVSADGLIVYDGNGVASSNIQAQFGDTATIGKTSGNSYNINITGTAIDLRYNTNILNRINSTGMVLYDGGGTADSNKIASFGTNSIILGKNNEAHSMLTSSQFTVYDQYQNVLFDIDTSDQLSSYVTTDYTADGETIMFTPSTSLYSELISVTVDNIEKTEGIDFYHYHEQRKIVFLEPPQDGSQVSIQVHSLSWAGSATIGCRANIQSIGNGSIVLGEDNTASGDYSLAEGYRTIASSFGAHAEGHSSHATGYAAHSEGYTTYAEGYAAHSEGYFTQAEGEAAHSEGRETYAEGNYTHTEGRGPVARGDYSHAQNYHTYAVGQAQTVMGTYNKMDFKKSTATTHPSGTLDYCTYALIIGNGTGELSSQRSNALTVDWNGNVIGQAMAGIIQMFAGSTPPTGWLVCDGTSYLRSDYPTLFEALGGTSSPWGLPDSTHFNVPDLRGRAPIGTNTALNNANTSARLIGDTGGNEDLIIPYHNHSVNSVPIGSSGGHSHTITNKYTNGQLASGTNSPRFRTDGNTSTTNFSSIASNTGTHTHSVPSHNTNYAGTSDNKVGANMMPYAVVNFIICTGKTS